MSQNTRTALIIGGSSGVGRALAEKLAENGFSLYLVARGEKDLATLTAHLNLTYKVKAEYGAWDLNSLDEHSAFDRLNEVQTVLGSISHLFLVSGANSDSDALPMRNDVARKLIQVNQIAPILILNHCVSNLESLGLKSISVCSTIAAPVPRKRNIAYATAKAALESYALGVRHYLADQNLPLQIYRLGYVETNLSFGQKLLFPAVSPSEVAQKMFDNLEKDLGISYFPFYWRFIVLILRSLPWKIYQKLKF